MADEEKKTLVGRIGDIASLKEIITGILVIVGVIGGIYGSFKPETLAKEAHQNLAPVVDTANKATQNNSEELKRQSLKLKILEEKFKMVELMNVALVRGEGQYVDMEDLYNLFSRRYADEHPTEKKHMSERHRAYEQKINIKPRAKTYWEQSEK